MNIKVNSKEVKIGDTFIAIGNGHNHIEEAIKNGASKIICEKGTYSVETINVENTHEYLINYLYNNYYEQLSKLKLIGITGTNGKTTTSYLIYQALNKCNVKCAYIGTIGFYIENKIKDLNNTTPDIYELYTLLLECVNKDCEYVVMEVSSIALALDRVKSLKFDIAIFTNLTVDHLDFHHSMGEYALSKQKLFNMVKEDGIKIVNNDSKYKEYFMNDNCLTYGFTKSDYTINSYNLNMYGTSFKMNGMNYNMKLIGKHNIYNMVVTLIVLEYLGLNCDIETLKHPDGRMDMINYKDNMIIIDYAHTPDALLNIINTVKEIEHNKIYVVFGCGGNRDKSKRPIMGTIATSEADYAIFTSDNPRDEEIMDIINDMLTEVSNTNYEIVQNRESAINKAIQMLENNDILLVLGKGHETYQIIKNIKYEFDDKKIVLDIIRS